MKTPPEIKIFETPENLAEQFSEFFTKRCLDLDKNQDRINVCLSGGRTPRYIFTHLAQEFSHKLNWEKIHFYWGDERCVPSDDVDSNYGMTKSHLLDLIEIPDENIHFIDGSEPPENEAKKYAVELSNNIKTENGLPCFDILMLGLGEDGHTASIFQDNLNLISTSELTAVTEHPLSQKQRITLTGGIINNAKQIIVLITGKHKAEIAYHIYNKSKMSEKYPAAYISPLHGELIWFMDCEAASLIQ